MANQQDINIATDESPSDSSGRRFKMERTTTNGTPHAADEKNTTTGRFLIVLLRALSAWQN